MLVFELLLTVVLKQHSVSNRQPRVSHVETEIFVHVPSSGGQSFGDLRAYIVEHNISGHHFFVISDFGTSQ